MVEISIDQAKLSSLIKKLESLEKADFSRPIKRSAEIMAQDIRNNFDKQGAIFQGEGFTRKGGALANLSKATTRKKAWQPLALSTRRQRQALGFSPARPIMIRTGKLKRSFGVKSYNNKEAVVGTNIKWAIYHQLGGDKLPQRRLVGFSKKGKAAIKIVFINHIKGLIKGFVNRL